MKVFLLCEQHWESCEHLGAYQSLEHAQRRATELRGSPIQWDKDGDEWSEMNADGPSLVVEEVTINAVVEPSWA